MGGPNQLMTESLLVCRQTGRYPGLATLRESPQLTLNPHYAHPMREDVKQKPCSTPLHEASIGAYIQAPFFFVERVLVLTPGAPQSTTGIRIAVGSPLSGFMQRSRHHWLRSCASQPLA